MYRGNYSATGPGILQIVEDYEGDPVGGARVGGLDAVHAAPRVLARLPSPLADSGTEELPDPDAGTVDWIARNGVEPWALAEPHVEPGSYQRPEPVRADRAPWVSAARIMVVDDRADVRELLGDYLESEGYTVDALGDATEALRRLAEFRPGVVLLDIRMPGLSGLSALQEIRAHRRDVGVIMVTGVGERTIAERSLALGAFDYVTKPIDFGYLMWSIETYFLTRQVLCELGDKAREIGGGQPRG
jgi:CheY-like chemotaxis protein